MFNIYVKILLKQKLFPSQQAMLTISLCLQFID